MSTGFKLVLYVILVIATLVSGVLFFKNFGKLFEEKKPAAETTGEVAAAPAEETVDTNSVAPTTEAGDTNAVATVTNSVTDTNVTAEVNATNAPPDTNEVAPAPAVSTKRPVKR